MESGWSYVLKRLGLMLLVLVLALIFFFLGLVLGYGVLGDGENPLAILSPDKWQSLIGKFTGN